ncbi:hypothetical protein K1T71_002149 [Dendrolimus kikuchii]|uniref:Uncharacterized protein n=1 Tax=Dendrolimus kikuchii TaxID=765133 RepID=A0ACC1DG25_9NEOP|nr:hypothetical protein K1T71_002149 [Dendrolimus kikuchii]
MSKKQVRCVRISLNGALLFVPTPQGNWREVKYVCMNVFCITLILLLNTFTAPLIYYTFLQPELCQITPKEKHCLIEYSVRNKWPHQKRQVLCRYVFNWYMKNCFEIRWSDHCPSVPIPTVANNFATERECYEECGGWA